MIAQYELRVEYARVFSVRDLKHTHVYQNVTASVTIQGTKGSACVLMVHSRPNHVPVDYSQSTVISFPM